MNGIEVIAVLLVAIFACWWARFFYDEVSGSLRHFVGWLGLITCAVVVAGAIITVLYRIFQGFSS